MKKYEIKLSYTPPIGGKHNVAVAGSFNDWEPQAMQAVSGNYEIILQLPAGKYSYKFIVDNQWQADANADFYESDNQGGRNSILLVKESYEPLFVVPIRFAPIDKLIETVNICGSFNDWDQNSLSLKKNAEGKFSTFLLLPPGSYQYKLLLNSATWITDPQNPHVVANNRAGYNSLLKVDNYFPRYDGNQEEIFTYNLINRNYPRAETIGKGWLRIACQVYKNNLDTVSALIAGSTIPLTKFYSEKNFDYYSATIRDRGIDIYNIQLERKQKKLLLKERGSLQIQRNSTELEWIQSGFIYQIFCDRFHNGDPQLNPDFSEWYYDPTQNPLARAVRQKLFRLEENWQNSTILKDHPQRNYTFFGGDLVGVKQKIPYLKELGITCIYFNPLVQAGSNHKYDTYDYFQIDPHFGGNQVFRELAAACQKNGISIILDFAFNHVGLGFFAFQDCLKNGKKSKYFNWFDWYKFPLPQTIPANFKATDYYQCWWGHATLPDLNYDLKRFHPDENGIHNYADAEINQPLLDYLMKVVEFWILEMDIAGFRLDVPNEVPFWFWKIFRQKVKSLKPQAYLVGEIWHNAEEWLDGYFDAVMNYTYFREPVFQFFALQNWTKQQFLAAMIQGLHTYGFYHLSLMMNLLDSHDTFRFLQACNGDLPRLKLALIFQASWIGIPHLFYGDEVGLQGGNDPDNRRPMNWDFSQDQELKDLHDFVRQLISIRSDNPTLIYGELIVRDDYPALIFLERRLADKKILIILNPTKQYQEISLPAGENYRDLLSKANLSKSGDYLMLGLEPESGKILQLLTTSEVIL
ncbi:MAG: alpha-amylase family glycosyl hydrolase [Candidatus Cloacimonadales bacterium]